MPDEKGVLEKRLSPLMTAKTELPLAFGATIRGDAPDAAFDKTVSVSDLPKISVDLKSPSIASTSTSTSSATATATTTSTSNAFSDLSIVKTIGEGGMGRVHLARQRSLDRDVAVKTLKSEASSAVSIALLREARITGALEHPGVIPVHALGADDRGSPLLVMKRVEGVDFAELLSDESHPIWAERTSAKTDTLAAKLEIMLQVCRTVEFAHARGIIHRDIKPENVMVGRYGEVYLLDWGIATKSGDVVDARGLVGTPGFMAPEMFMGGSVDERTDVYLLGATLHHVLTGRFRHEGADLMALALRAVESKPIDYREDVPDWLADLCNRATARDPNDRPGSAQAFRQSIAEFLLHKSALALSNEAEARLGTLESLFDEAGADAPPKDLAAAYRLATEARFGFAQSLREHPDHHEAVRGARAAVIALAELELRQGHAETAEALLRELDDPDRALLERVERVRAEEAARKKDAERLKAIERDRDPTIGRASRLVLAGLFAGSAAIGASLILSRTIVVTTSYGAAVVLSVFFPPAVAVSFLMRRRLFANAYSRNIAFAIYVALGVCLVDRWAGALAGLSVADVLTSNLWVTVGALATAAFAVERKLFGAVVPLIIAAIATRLFSSLATAIFSVAVVLSVGVFALLVWRHAPRTRDQ